MALADGCNIALPYVVVSPPFFVIPKERSNRRILLRENSAKDIVPFRDCFVTNAPRKDRKGYFSQRQGRVCLAIWRRGYLNEDTEWCWFVFSPHYCKPFLFCHYERSVAILVLWHSRACSGSLCQSEKKRSVVLKQGDNVIANHLNESLCLTASSS